MISRPALAFLPPSFSRSLGERGDGKRLASVLQGQAVCWWGRRQADLGFSSHRSEYPVTPDLVTCRTKNQFGVGDFSDFVPDFSQHSSSARVQFGFRKAGWPRITWSMFIWEIPPDGGEPTASRNAGPVGPRDGTRPGEGLVPMRGPATTKPGGEHGRLAFTLTPRTCDRIDAAGQKGRGELAGLRGHERGEPLNHSPAVPTYVRRTPCQSRVNTCRT